jgi:hypothetical protein
MHKRLITNSVHKNKLVEIGAEWKDILCKDGRGRTTKTIRYQPKSKKPRKYISVRGQKGLCPNPCMLCYAKEEEEDDDDDDKDEDDEEEEDDDDDDDEDEEEEEEEEEFSVL